MFALGALSVEELIHLVDFRRMLKQCAADLKEYPTQMRIAFWGDVTVVRLKCPRLEREVHQAR